jgi:hypothetical protein
MSVSFQKAATNGLREALHSFGCHLMEKVNESADSSVEPITLETSLEVDKHGLPHKGKTYFFLYIYV